MMDPLTFKFVDTLRPPCSKCNRPLILTRIEPEEAGCDLRIYYCAACEDTEVIISAIEGCNRRFYGFSSQTVHRYKKART